MKLQATIKKIKQRAKIVGLKVDIHEEKRKHDSAFNIRFENSSQVISFYSGRDYSDDDEGGEDATHLIKVTRDGDVSDIHTDYFAGSFVDNITQALNWVAPLPAKYSVGSLVRFKQNKRNARANLVGKIRLVIEAATGGNYKLLNPSQQSHLYSPYYSERDLEFVS
jgi:hypothetical protein